MADDFKYDVFLNQSCKDKPVMRPLGQQVQLGSSDRFWTLISERRAQKTISRRELEKRISKRT